MMTKVPPTGCDSRWWAGRDKGLGAGFAPSVENARKSRRIPPVGCRLCWHAFDVQDSSYFEVTHESRCLTS